MGPDLDPIGGPPGPPLIIIGPPLIGGIPRIIPRIGPGGSPRLLIYIIDILYIYDFGLTY